MKKRSPEIILLFLLIILFFNSACTGKKAGNTKTNDSAMAPETLVIDSETQLLIKDLADNGDYVNSREFPSLIKASIVKEEMGTNIQIIDLREPQIYAQGHIKGSVNIRFENIPGYFETGIKPFGYDKIVLVCDDGQISSYAASLLRLMGYGNVYAMRWGMSAWNRKLADKGWLSGLSSKYEKDLEKLPNERPIAREMPLLKTGFKTGSEIASERFKTLFTQGTANVLISADSVFTNPGKYFIINYERKDKYDDAHIPGAVRYKPNATLGFISEMASIPPDKTVVVYCGTGHNSGFATAYLRLMGYNAKTLRYGNNGFMHDWMAKDASSLSWLPFSDADINDFPLVK